MNHRTHRRLFALLGLFAHSAALGITPAEGTPGAGSAAAPATPAPPTPAAPAAAAPAPAAPAAPVPAAAAPAAPAPTLRSMVSAAVAAVKGGQAPAAALATITAERDAAVQRATTAEADLATARASLVSAQTAVTAFCRIFGLEAKDLVGKDAAAISALAQNGVNAAIGEQMATLGFPAKDLPTASAAAAAGGDALADIQAQMTETTDPKKLGALAAKANALRDGKKPSA